MYIILTLVVTYLFVTLLGHILHWSLHQRWMGKFNQSHMAHHEKLYPPSDYKSDTYRDAGKDSTTKFFALVTTPIIIGLIIGAFMFHVSWYLIIISFIEALLLGWLHDYLHDAFHLNNHFLRRIPVIKGFFIVWDDLHYVHHINMQKNFGIFEFIWDKVFGSFEL